MNSVLGSAQLAELDRAIRAAEQSSRFEFSVFVGASGEDSRADAVRRHATLSAPDRSVLVLVDPDRRVVEVVTGTDVAHKLSDDEVRLAVLAMETEFREGNLVGGLTRGLHLLAEHARR